jgi:hypothetical protein
VVEPPWRASQSSVRKDSLPHCFAPSGASLVIFTSFTSFPMYDSQHPFMRTGRQSPFRLVRSSDDGVSEELECLERIACRSNASDGTDHAITKSITLCERMPRHRLYSTPCFQDVGWATHSLALRGIIHIPDLLQLATKVRLKRYRFHFSFVQHQLMIKYCRACCRGSFSVNYSVK